MEKKPYLVDIAVLLVFFARPSTFRKVFSRVKEARPRELFLYQDGPRSDHPGDMENILECRKIAEDIDWDCVVHKLYQRENKGVDPSGYLADTWAFSQTDKCIVLEDDVVPSLSFFTFCKEMLDRYEDDPRVMLISGMNYDCVSKEIKTDYFFSSTIYLWGWASWSRVVKNWDPTYSFLNDKVKRREFQNYIRKKHLLKNMIQMFEYDKASGIERFETIIFANQYLNRGLSIVPKKNMIKNIGITEGASHFANNIALIPKGQRRIFTMKSYELPKRPLRHPKEISDYEPYRKRAFRVNAWGHPLVKIYRMVESFCYRLHVGQRKEAFDEVFMKFGKFFKRQSA